MREHFVRLFNGPCKRTIGGPRRRHFGGPEQWESIAARELKRDACDRNCDHECIKHTMGGAGRRARAIRQAPWVRVVAADPAAATADV